MHIHICVGVCVCAIYVYAIYVYVSIYACNLFLIKLPNASCQPLAVVKPHGYIIPLDCVALWILSRIG